MLQGAHSTHFYAVCFARLPALRYFTSGQDLNGSEQVLCKQTGSDSCLFAGLISCVALCSVVGKKTKEVSYNFSLFRGDTKICNLCAAPLPRCSVHARVFVCVLVFLCVIVSASVCLSSFAFFCGCVALRANVRLHVFVYVRAVCLCALVRACLCLFDEE